MNNKKSKPVKRKFLESDDSSDDEPCLGIRERRSKNNISSDSAADEDDSSLSSSASSESDSSLLFLSSSSSSSSSSSTSKSSVKAKKSPGPSKIKNLPSDSSSESGDENCEKCAICLRSITNQEVGNPEVCDHIFCSVCIIEWSKNSNVCPLDRQQFSIILVRDHKSGTVVRKESIGEEGRTQDGHQFWRMIQEEYVDDTVCEICGQGDREDIMLLCDLCDRGFHTVCLTPPLENIPDENEWFCPDCNMLGPSEEIIEELPSQTLRSLRPRFSMVRTRLLERIRMTVNRIVENYVLRQSDSVPASLTDSDLDSDSSVSSDLDMIDINQPSTSGLQRGRRSSRTTANRKKATNSRKKTSKTTKTSGKRKRKRKTTTASTRKRKTTTTNGKRKTKRRRTKVKTTRTKKVKVENEDGTVTEKIVKTRTYKRRRQKTRKKKPKTTSNGLGRGLRVKSKQTPKTVKGRLTLKLKMMPPNKPGQLLPDVKIRPPNSHISSIDLNRARAGIPKLHIFGPRDELQYYSSESDHEGFAESGSGGVLTATQTRTNISRIQNRKKAALLLQSTASTTSLTKPKPVIESPCSESVDILGSILDSQAIWHSKNTNVKINDDGSIEVLKDDKKAANDVSKPKNSNKTAGALEKSPEVVVTQAPMYPGSGSRPGGFRPYNRNSYGDSRSGQDNMFGPRGGSSQGGANFNRFGGPARNDREGYTNYLNSMPQGPTPFCRGGPPLRFRMPPRQQLRRIPFPPRNRPAWNAEEESDDGNSNDKEEKKTEEEGEEEKETKNDKAESKRQEEDEDIDLYSDIETSMDKTDNSGAEDTTTYPALGPPPEPSPFLLGLNESEDFGVDSKGKSEVYDPAEPCDSDDEMVIDENRETASVTEKKDLPSDAPKAETNSDADNVTKSTSQKCSSEDDDDEDCPIFSIYSSATRAFSEKEEEEREREIAEDRRRLEEAKKQEEEKSKNESVSLTDEKKSDENLKSEVTKEEPCKEDAEASVERQDKPKEKPQAQRLSFPIDEDVDSKSDDKSSAREERSRSPELGKEISRSRSISPTAFKDKEKQRSPSVESDKEMSSTSLRRLREKSSSTDRTSEKFKRSTRKKKYDSDSGADAAKSDHDPKSDDDKENDDTEERVARGKKEDKTPDKEFESEDEAVLSPQKTAVGLEGLDVEEVSSDNEGDEFADKRSMSSLSLSDLSNKSPRSVDSDRSKKKKKNRKKKTGKSKTDKNHEDEEREERLNDSKNENDEVGNENSVKAGEKRKGRKSGSEGLERQVLGSKENKKSTDKSKDKDKDKDLSWKKPSKKDKNYREGKKKSKERGRSKSNERRKSRSPTPKKDKRKNKERKKKADKKKDMERYDVRKIVKNKEVRKTDAFGRDIVSKSRSISRSRSRSPMRDRSRNMLRRDSRSFSRSRSRSFRRGRSPVRRRYLRSRSRSRSKSVTRRSYSRSRSRSRSRKTKKKPKSKDRLKVRSRSRGRKSRSGSRGGRRRSLTRSRSRSPAQRVVKSKKTRSRRRSWSHHESRTPSFSPRRSRSISRSPIRVRRTYSRSVSRSWSRGRSPLPRASSLEKLTVILTTKDKKKWKKKKDGKKARKEEKKKKKAGNSKEVFASGDNVLVSVNFRNNNSSTGNDGSSITNNDRNTRLNSLSPTPALETPRKRKRGSDYESEKVTKKSKKSSAISKKVVDVALSNSCSKRAKKLTRLSEKDAEVILNRKPVAVIDLDMSPYREQTPSPVNVVVVSDSGSGDEGKERSPQRPNVRGTPNVETEKVEENVGGPSVDASTTNSPVENGYVPTLGPKTPPEPQIKFSINKPQQLRPIANPLGDDDDDEEEEEEDREDERGGPEIEERMESLDIRIEKELNQRSEVSHKGPNTPPTPRGPSTPKSPPSPQSSPDAYDPFEPTKSRSPTPSQDDKENHPTSKSDAKEDETSESVQGEGLTAVVSNSMTEELNKTTDVVSESQESKTESSDKSEPGAAIECSSSNVAAPSQGTSAPVSDNSPKESPERKISVVISTPQSKSQTSAVQKTFSPVLKQVPIVSSSATVQSTSANIAVSTDIFALSSPTKTRTSTSTTTATTQTLQVSGIQRLQHRLGSPVNRTPSSVKSTPEKRTTPRPESNNEIFSSGNYMVRNVSKRNGEQPKQTRPLQDATNETIDMTMDMDDSPYSPASSEGDDLFDPPPEVSKPSQSNSKATPSHKPVPKAHHKSPTKQLSKFDLLFGIGGPTLSPLKVGSKKPSTKLPGKPPAVPKQLIPPKPQKKGSSKRGVNKMDEDQLRILDELPSSAVELQVKDKFLKKLNRQERVVDEVKTVLKPHYARKHITKEEYKDILRRSVPKICHSRSGEINPSKIQSLIEAYVRKFRHAKKKGMNTVAKPKVKKTMFS